MVRQFSSIKRSHSPYQATDVQLRGLSYAPHRHDSYTFAITYRGVQSFNYRRALRYSLPGQLVVLHPDEVHDGEAGTEDGFAYRSISLKPHVMRTIIKDAPLPHLQGGVSSDKILVQTVKTLCSELEKPLDELERLAALESLVLRFQEIAGSATRASKAPDSNAAHLARMFIEDNLLEPITLDAIANAADKDRWELSRAFKRTYGTSPYRYITMRRVEMARHMLSEGMPISEAAAACQFFDQSHLTRHFKQSYGLTPARWLALST